MDTKQVIVIRKDLGMRKGKMIAQGAHASMGAVFSQSRVEHTSLCDQGLTHKNKVIPLEEHLEKWFNTKFTKIAVSCDSEQELLDLANKAEEAGILHFICKDAGLTEFGGVPTYTALAIGPATVEEIDKITGHLKLL